MSLYFSLNYQKRKSQYSQKELIPIVLYYYYHGKKIKLSTEIKVTLKNWNGSTENPIRKSDLDSKFKNLHLKQFKIEVEKIIQQIELNDQVPDPKLIKIYLKKLSSKKVVNTKRDFDFFILRNEYERIVLSDLRLTKNYRRNVVNSLNQISYFIKDQLESQFFQLSGFDDDFQKEYLNYSIKIKKRRNPTIQKHLKHLKGFLKWCRKNGYIDFYLDLIPITTDFDVDVIYLQRDEVLKLFKFDDFNFVNPNHPKYTKEYFTDHLKNDKKITYTNLEVYNDMLVFGCGVGCRFGDLINLKLDNYEFGENRTKGFFVFRMEKSRTGKKVRIPVNQLTYQIWKKYSKNKSRQDFLFPRMLKGNPISNQKMNKHLKVIGEIVGLKRWISKPSYTSDGKIEKGTDIRQPLYNFITTHIIRRTFIREGIESNIPVHIVMSMSGHSSEKVFRNYFSTTENELKTHGSKLFSFDLNEGDTTTKENPFSNKELESQLETLKSLFEKGLIPISVYEKKVTDLIDSN
jgi:integrase